MNCFDAADIHIPLSSQDHAVTNFNKCRSYATAQAVTMPRMRWNLEASGQAFSELVPVDQLPFEQTVKGPKENHTIDARAKVEW